MIVKGPLSGLRIVEMAGIGPAPFGCMMLADHGAEVIRVCRIGGAGADPAFGTDPCKDVLLRSRTTIEVDIKTKAGAQIIADLVGQADGIVEGFRPGVMERLGLGPDVLLSVNPRLVYGRMTGWGQEGPLAQSPGHDINYISLNGILNACPRPDERPTPPMNLIGDFGGGGMLLAFGMVSALLHAKSTGCGQVVDCAMSDGASLLMSMMWSFRAQGMWRDQPGSNLLDGGAHFYNSYQTADGGFMAVGAMEPKFYRILLEKLGLDKDVAFSKPMDHQTWPGLKAKIASAFKTKTRAEWTAMLEDVDSCVTPVLSMSDALNHPHNLFRNAFVEDAGVVQPAPAPRYSTSVLPSPTMSAGLSQAVQVLTCAGYDESRIDDLKSAGVIA